MTTEFVVPDQGAERSTAERSVLLFIDFLEHSALVELDRLVQIFKEVRLTDIHQLDLETARSFRLLHEIVKPSPRSLKLLQRLRMHDFIELPGNECVEIGNAAV